MVLEGSRQQSPATIEETEEIIYRMLDQKNKHKYQLDQTIPLRTIEIRMDRRQNNTNWL